MSLWMRSRSGRRTWTRPAVAIAAVSACALLATGCSDDPGEAGSGASGSGVSADSSPGVTDTTVKIGFIIADRGELGNRLGFKTINPGTVETRTAGINAVVANINASGGVGGRQIVPVVRTYEAVNDSPEQAEALCKAFTQDDQVFAVYLDGQLQNNARPCYKAGNAIMLDSSAIAQDQGAFDQYGGYLWSPSNPEYGAFMRTQIRSIAATGYFNGNTGVQLLTSDDEVSRRVSQTIVRPELAAAGVTTINENFIDGTNQGTLGASIAAGQVAGTSAGLNRAIAVGGARILPLVLATFEANDFKAVWGMSTYDNPFNIQNNKEGYVQERYDGMVGLGYSAVIDTSDPATPFPDPANAAQVRCKQIVDASPASQPPQDLRANYQDAFKFCDAAFFLKAVLDKAPKNLNVETFKQGAFAVTNEYQSAIGFSAAGGPNVYAPVNSARPMKWDAAQNLFVYTAPPVPFPAS
jgi:hypothetical protein